VKQLVLEVCFLSWPYVAATHTEGMRTSAQYSQGLHIEVGNDKNTLYYGN